MAEGQLTPGARVVFVGTEAWSIELYGATGTVLDTPKETGYPHFGVLFDPEYDEWQMVGAYQADELEQIDDGVTVTIEPRVRATVGLPGSKPLVCIERRGWCPESYERNGVTYRQFPGDGRVMALRKDGNPWTDEGWRPA